MRVFVTGHRGYIGAHLVELLKAEGHSVTGCDLGLFDGCEWEPLVSPDLELRRDVRGLTERDLEGHDAVMHLAAISNDPMGELDADLTYAVNLHGSVRLAEVAKRAGVPRFLFSSSCSIYGAGGDRDLDESAPVNPLTAYAVSKVETEKRVAALADRGFSPVFLRNSTAYGHSRNLRVDLVANNLLACALARGDIRIQSDGTPWRPLVHCRDIARAFIALASAPRERVHNAVVNVGGNGENYRVREVAGQVGRLVPNASIVYTGEVGADPRNYRVNFDLLGRLLPKFRLEHDLASGLEELHRKFVEHGFGKAEFEGDRFVRLRTLKKRMRLLSR
ncbi:MAG: SDR family oxidoreductase [Candidatus Aureabacteria bacterium]|nr:SDR family oxidoreductase [Candidatus Auribacterota bacterium]